MKTLALANAKNFLWRGALLSAVLLVSACGGGDSTGLTGQSVALRTVPEPAGVNCATGGTKIEAGPDSNASGSLETGEVNSTAYVCNGQAGLVGLTGAAGIAGLQGLAGAAGATGPAGATGTTGSIGPSGPAGATGITGSIGPSGPAGATGTTGSIGPSGPAGATGITGSIGPSGPAGATGTTGSIGPSGPAGATGTTGSIGPSGQAGATGTVGLTGSSGPQGVAGTTGLTGLTGSPGATGSPGTNGTNGTAGLNSAIQVCLVPVTFENLTGICGGKTSGPGTLIQAGKSTINVGFPDDPGGITSTVLICGFGSAVPGAALLNVLNPISGKPLTCSQLG